LASRPDLDFKAANPKVLFTHPSTYPSQRPAEMDCRFPFIPISRIAIPIPELQHVHAHSHEIPMGKWETGIPILSADSTSHMYACNVPTSDYLAHSPTSLPRDVQPHMAWEDELKNCFRAEKNTNRALPARAVIGLPQ